MIKALLLIGGKKYDISRGDLYNWDEIEISFKRKDFGGVYRSFSNKFEFVKNAYYLLEKEFLANYLRSSAVIVIGVLNNSWTYNEKIRCQLDFSTYSNNGHIISMNGIDDSAEAIINANKSQVYDIPVSSLNPEKLFYDRMELKNSVNFILAPDSNENVGDENIGIINDPHLWMSLPFGYGNIEFPVKGVVEVGDSYGEWESYNSRGDGKYFVRALKDCEIKIDLSFLSKIESRVGTNNRWSLNLIKWKGGRDFRLYSFGLYEPDWINVSYSNSIILEKGDELSLTISRGTNIPQSPDNDSATFRIKDFSLNVSYIGRNKFIYIDVFNPNALLTSLLSNMGLTNMTGDIHEQGANNAYMMAAESVRDIKEAKVHTSFSKFAEWARACFGCYYTIEGDKVIFKHLTQLYDPTEVRELDHVNELEVSVSSSLIYSGVEVGYEKKDYDEINGRDEFHVKNSFSTGLSINDNILKLISPYRADCYGIEFLAQKRDEETKDDASDNDLFFVDAILSASNPQLIFKLILNRQGELPSGVLFPQSVFNVAYSPRRMLLANKEYISSCTNQLTFTASERNADAVLLGVSEKAPIRIDESFFRIEDIKVSTIGLSPFPPFYKGVISFSFNNRVYEGYISDVTEKIGKSQSTEYKLICKKIE